MIASCINTFAILENRHRSKVVSLLGCQYFVRIGGIREAGVIGNLSAAQQVLFLTPGPVDGVALCSFLPRATCLSTCLLPSCYVVCSVFHFFSMLSGVISTSPLARFVRSFATCSGVT